MDTINIVSSQAVLEMSSFSMDTRSMSSSPPFQFIHTMDLSVVLVDTMLHDSPYLVIHRTEI